MLRALLPLHQPIRGCALADQYSVTPLPHLAFKYALLKLIKESMFFEHELSWTPCLEFYHKHCTFFHYNLVSGGSLCCMWVSRLKFGWAA